MKSVGIIHTSFVSVDDLRNLFAEIAPKVTLTNIVDDSLLRDVMKNGGITQEIIRRVCVYAMQLEALGVDLIFNQCSSVGEAADVASQMVRTPVLKVDQAMAEEAVRLGRRISVVATVASTVAPSVSLVERTAAQMGREVEVVARLVDGALDILMKEGDRDRHNALVLDEVKQAQADSDVIVLAQGSMVVLLPLLDDCAKPVLTSPRLGVERARDILCS